MDEKIIIALLVYTSIWIGIYLLGKLFHSEKYGLEIKPYYLMYKTKAFNDKIKEFSRKYKKIWKIIFNIGVAIGFGEMIFIVYVLAKNAYFLINEVSQASPTFLLLPLPGLTISWENFPYVIISISFLLLTHELAHAIASLMDEVPIKTTGVFFALVVPGGFVEVDEEKLEKSKSPTKLRVFASGSFTNMLIGIFMILLLSNFTLTISPFYSSSSNGVLIINTVEGGPAQKAGIQKWDIIYSLNGTKVKDVKTLSDFMKRVLPNSVLVVTTKKGSFLLSLNHSLENSSRAIIGIYSFNYYEPRFELLPAQIPYHLYMLENWMQTIFISVALINMLPLYPLDGDRFLDAVLKMLSIKKTKRIRIMISSVAAMILGLNLALSFLNFGFIKI
ncbi:MAG: site-2 protease family protein [Candidatus Bathyarchaeia archaeon]